MDTRHRSFILTACAFSCYNENKKEDKVMNKCKYVDICSRNCGNECRVHKMHVRRRITYTVCCIVGMISTFLIMGFAGSLECDRITVGQFIAMSVLPMVLVIASVEIGNMVKEDE